MANSTFLATVCEPYQFGPISEGSILTLCFLDFILVASTIILLALFGLLRLFQIRRRTFERRRYTRSHIFELILCGVNVLLPLGDLIYSIVAYSYDPIRFPLPWMKYFVVFGLFFTWLSSFIIMELEYRVGLKRGWVVVTFWVLSAIIGAFRCQSYIYEEQWINGTLYFVIIELIVSVLLCFNIVLFNKLPPSPNEDFSSADNSDFSMDELSNEEDENLLKGNSHYSGIHDDGIERIAEDKVNVFMRYSFHWLTPLLRLGSRQQIIMEDLPDLVQEDYASKQIDDFEVCWREETKKEHPSLTNTIVKLYGWQVVAGGVFKLANDIVLFSGPIFLRQIVMYVIIYFDHFNLV